MLVSNAIGEMVGGLYVAGMVIVSWISHFEFGHTLISPIILTAGSSFYYIAFYRRSFIRTRAKSEDKNGIS